MDLQCIFCIGNSSYAFKTPKDEVTCNTYWNFYKKLKIWTVSIKTGNFEIKRDDWRQPLKTEVSRSKREGWNICSSVICIAISNSFSAAKSLTCILNKKHEDINISNNVFRKFSGISLTYNMSVICCNS